MAGVALPGVSQGLGRGLDAVGFRVHGYGLAVPEALRQPKKRIAPIVIPGRCASIRNLKQLGDDILDLDTNDKLGISTAAGTWVAQTAFEALCPKAAAATRSN